MACHHGKGIVVCGGDDETGPWQSAVAKWPEFADHDVPVSCCERWVKLRDAEAQFYSAFSGYLAGHRYRCAADKGCNINPGYKRTKHLRCIEYC